MFWCFPDAMLGARWCFQLRAVQLSDCRTLFGLSLGWVFCFYFEARRCGIECMKEGMCTVLSYDVENLHKDAQTLLNMPLFLRHTLVYVFVGRLCFAFAAPGTTAGLSDVDSSAAEITNVVIGNLGGTGTYGEVVGMAPGADMLCTDAMAACEQKVRNRFWLDSAGPVSSRLVSDLLASGNLLRKSSVESCVNRISESEARKTEVELVVDEVGRKAFFL